MSATKQLPRQRKVQCDQCGYVARVTRSWMSVGLLSCPCGGTLAPTDPADMAFIGLIEPQDVPGPVWTQICRVNGWDGSVRRKGAAQLAHDRKTGWTSLYADRSPASHCAYPGCGKWIKAGADVCSAGHPQDADIAAAAVVAPVENTMPF